MPLAPRLMATTPVRLTSTRPKGRMRLTKASIFSGAPVISKTNPEDQPILWVMLTADEGVPLFEQMMYARNTLKNQLSTLDGVGTVELAGYVDSNLRVWVDREKLYGYELMAGDVTNAIQTEQTEQPAGRIEAPKTELNIRVLGETRAMCCPGCRCTANLSHGHRCLRRTMPRVWPVSPSVADASRL